MADLKFQEKRIIEEVFGMSSGYVLDFSDRTFSEFFDDFQINIDDPKYNTNGGSKANRLRTFFTIEPDGVVRQILCALLDYAQILGGPTPEDINRLNTVVGNLGTSGHAVTTGQDLSDIWKPGHLRLFLSHLAAHKIEASEFKSRMLAYGVSCFVAHEDIEPTSLWQPEIEKALFSMHSLVALLREGFRASSWTDQELGVAFGRQVPIVPIRLGVDPYGLIGKYQAMSGANKTPEALADEVYSILWEHKDLHTNLAEGLISRLETSDSWSVSKFLLTPMQRITDLTPDLISRIRAAAENNRQVRDAFGVPDKLDTLIERVVASPAS